MIGVYYLYICTRNLFLIISTKGFILSLLVG